MVTEKVSIYLAGPLFGIADRHHNLLLARELERLGYLVHLPQKDAIDFFDGQKFDLTAISINCKKRSVESDVVVANIDGPDADSGTSLEVGMAILASTASTIKKKPLVICVRTDFRTNREEEIGVNGMFNLADRVIYMPAYVNSPEEVKQFYKNLAKKIDGFIKAGLRK